MNDEQIIRRLSRLASGPVAPEVADRHRVLLARASAPDRHGRRLAPLAAAIVVTAGAGVGFLLSGGSAAPGDSPPAPQPDPPTSTVVDPFPNDPCKGPPPFAGRTPEGDTEAERAANREAEARAWEEFKARYCPDEEPFVGPGPLTTPAEQPAPTGPPSSVPGPPDHVPGPPDYIPGPPNEVPGLTRPGAVPGSFPVPDRMAR